VTMGVSRCADGLAASARVSIGAGLSAQSGPDGCAWVIGVPGIVRCPALGGVRLAEPMRFEDSLSRMRLSISIGSANRGGVATTLRRSLIGSRVSVRPPTVGGCETKQHASK